MEFSNVLEANCVKPETENVSARQIESVSKLKLLLGFNPRRRERQTTPTVRTCASGVSLSPHQKWTTSVSTSSSSSSLALSTVTEFWFHLHFPLSLPSAAPPMRVATTRTSPPPAITQHKRPAIWAHRDPTRRCCPRRIIRIQDTVLPPLRPSIRCEIMRRWVKLTVDNSLIICLQRSEGFH